MPQRLAFATLALRIGFAATAGSAQADWLGRLRRRPARGLAMMNRTPQVLALLVTATVLGGPAWAQNAAPSAPAQATRPERGAATQVERRIAGLQSRLRITPAQQPQWDAFANVMRENAAHVETLQHERADKVATMNASEDMRSYADVARVHADDLQHLAAAFDTLYADMTPEQKAAADRTFHEFQGRRRARPHS